MNYKYLPLLLVFATAVFFIHANALPGTNLAKPLFAPDKIKIQLTSEAYQSINIPDEMYAEVESFQIKELDALLTELKVTKIIRAHRRVKDTDWELENGFHRWFLLTVPNNTDIMKSIELIKVNKYIQDACTENLAYADYIPNDPYYPNNWGHNNTSQLLSWFPPGDPNGSHSGPPVGTTGFDSNAPQAWSDSQGLGNPNVIIGIIDTGVDSSHPDLRLVPGFSSIGDDPNDTSPLGGHGTACAGIAAAIGNNALGVVGIAAGCTIMPLRAGTSNGFYDTPIANALTYAADHGVDIISMSFGGYHNPNNDYLLALEYAYNHGITLFASAGNDNISTDYHHPSNSPYVISVGAASPCGERKSNTSCDGDPRWGSNWGPDIQDDDAAIDIMAPTVLPTTDITGTAGYTDSNYYMFFAGTSCSSPYAAGVAALLLSKWPTLNRLLIRDILTSTATDMTIDGGSGWDMYTGYGLVNAEAALAALPSLGAKIWTGAVSSNWHLSSNWENGAPIITDDVMIYPVSAGHFYPSVISGQALSKNLYLGYGASLTVTAYSLTVNQNLNSYGNLQITGDADVIVNGNISWGSGATANMTNSNAELCFSGNMYFKAGSNINITNGTVVFSGATGNGIYVNQTAQIYNLRNAKSTIQAAGFGATSTHDIYINGDFTILNDRVFRNYSPQTLHLKGNFINGINSVFIFDYGTLSFEGTSNHSLINNSTLTSYFNNLNFAMASGVSLTLMLTNSTSINVWGNITINSGIFNCNYRSINLKGNWVNNAGETAFTEGDGAVIFKGTGNQYCSSENFGTIELNKPSGELIFTNGAVVSCQKYYWVAGVYRVSNATFNVTQSIINPGIYGTIYLDSGSINYTQDVIYRNDLNGTLNIAGGTFSISGGSTDSYWNYGAAVYLNMTGGVLDFKTQSIIISDQADEVHINLLGGVIRTIKDYRCFQTNTHLNGGTLELYGTGSNSIYLTATSSVYNLIINKGPVRSDENMTGTLIEQKSISREGEQTRNERLDTVNALTHLTINGALTVNQGTLDVGAYNITAGNGISVLGTLKKNAIGSIITYGDFIWQNGSHADITAGSITCGRHWRFQSGCTADLSLIQTTLNAGQPAEITSSSPNAWFGFLTISGSGMVAPASFTLTASSTETLIIKGWLMINGNNKVYFTKPVRVDDNLRVYGPCTLNIGPAATLSMANSKSLIIYTGAYLEVLGTQESNAKITHQAVGQYYNLNIESGAHISAEYAIFEYMTSGGVNVKTGALVDLVHTFHYCTFQNAVTGTAWRLLTVDNNQVLNIYGANFPIVTNPRNKNVYKNVDSGQVNLYNSIGSFSGSTFEYDTYNRINWNLTPCELSISDYWTVSDVVYVGEENSYGIEILNDSDYSTYLPVRVDVYCNSETMPSLSEVGDEYLYIDPLGPGESVSIEILTVPSTVACTWKTWFRVNRLNEISETDYNNNGDGYVTTQWLALPVVQITTIAYNSQTGQVELTWTYPSYPTINVQIDAFNIYRSTSPHGPFNYKTGSTSPTARTYSEPAGGAKYFYQVKAENTWP